MSPEASTADAHAMAQRAAVARGQALFNRADFWASHEAWEAAWLVAVEPERRGLQGLIQAAAAFHKFVVQNNPAGAVRLIERALEGVAGMGPTGLGLDLAALGGELRQWHARLSGMPPEDASIIGLPRLDAAPSVRGAVGRERAPLHVEAIDLHLIETGGRRTLLVSVEADGRVGWGETPVPWNDYGIWEAASRGVAPALLTETVGSPAELPILWRGVVAQGRAAAALENAMWDLAARREELPLSVALGCTPRTVTVVQRVHGVTAAALAAGIGRARSAGFAGVLVPARPNADQRLLPALAAELQGLWFAIDLDGAYRLADRHALAALDRLGPAFLHRPFPRWATADVARLGRWLRSPISISGLTNPDALDNAHALGALAVAQVDPSVVGLSEAKLMLDTAARLGVPAWVGGTSLTAVGARAALGVACAAGATLPCAPGDGFGLWGDEVLGDGGRWAHGADRGVGVEPPPEWIAAHEVLHERLHV